MEVSRRDFLKFSLAAGTEVLLEDLESVDLDVAAIEQGYVRPQGNGFALDLRVAARSTAVNRFFDLWT